MAGALALAAATACSKPKDSEADWKADQGATVPATADSLSTERMDTMSSGGTVDASQPADAPARPKAKPDPAAAVPQPAPDSAPARSSLDTLSKVPTDSATPGDSASWTEAEKRDTTIETVDSAPDSAGVKLNLSPGDSATEPAPQALAAEPSPDEPSPVADSVTTPPADAGAITADTITPTPVADQAAATEPTPAADTLGLSAITPEADSVSDWNSAATGADSTTEATAMAPAPADTSNVDTSMPVDTTETPSGYSERETEPVPPADSSMTVEDTSVTAATQPAEEREYVAAPTEPSPVDTTESTALATGDAEMARDTAIPSESDSVDEQDQSIPEEAVEAVVEGAEEPVEEVAEAVAPESDSTVTAPSEGNIMTGAEVVSSMTRQDQQCAVAAPESDLAADLQWDMSRTPANVNPCGVGTMVISSLVTGDQVNAATDGGDDAAKPEEEDIDSY